VFLLSYNVFCNRFCFKKKGHKYTVSMIRIWDAGIDATGQAFRDSAICFPYNTFMYVYLRQRIDLLVIWVR